MTQSSTLKAGAAKVDITPQVGCWLEGIPRAEPSNAIHDPLQARALVLEQHDIRACLVVCDLIGMSNAYATEVRQRIAAALGMPWHNVIVACAHNHSGPAMIGFDDPARVDQAYLSRLASDLVQVAQSAAQAVQPALLGVGRGQETTISEYRRLWTRDGRIVMNWEEFDPKDIVGPAEEGDPELGVVKLEDPQGRTIAVLFNYACHPNSLPGDNFTITSDFPGYAAAAIERELGGIALFTNGAQGSVDIEGWVDRDLYGVERRGKALAQAVLEVCSRIVVQPDALLRVARRSFLLPYRKVPADLLAWAQEVARRDTGQAQTLRDGIPDEWKAANILRLAALAEPGVDFELVGLRLGKAAFVSIPGELFTEIGRRMKALSRALQVHVIGLANGYHGYIATAKASAEGGYATDIGTGAYYAENAEDLICEQTALLLEQLS